MNRTRPFSIRRVTIASLSVLAVAGCSQVIGLGDYKVGDNSSGAGNSESGNSNVTAGSANAGASGSTVEMKPDGGGIKPDAGGKPEGGGTSAGGTGGEAGEPSGATGGVAEGGGAGTGVGGTGVGGTGVGGTGVGGTGVGGGSAGASVGGSAGASSACPTGCDDGIACTIDLCDSTGCVHTPVDALCTGTCMKCSATLGCQDKSTTTELLTNGNFDTGTGTGWAQTSTSYDVNNDATPDTLVLIKTPPASITAQSAPDILALGVKNNEQTFVTQPVTIPANAATVTLTGYAWVKSADTLAGDDQAWIDLTTDPNDPNTFQNVFSKVWYNENTTTTWVAFSENADMSAITPSQSVWLTALGLNDPSQISNFYFDSLSLKAKVCSP